MLTTPTAPRHQRLAAIAGALVLAAPIACGKKDAPAAPAADPAAAAEPAPSAAPPAVDPGLAVPEGASVALLEPNDSAIYVVGDGQEKAKIHVRFGLSGMSVKPAGEIVPGTGHHHLIINGPGTEFGQPVPKTETSIHYGQGQTEADIELAPGSYELTAQFANGAHLSYGDKMRATIKIRVEKPTPPVDPAMPVVAPGDQKALAPGAAAIDPAAAIPGAPAIDPAAAKPGAPAADPAAAAPPVAGVPAPPVADPAAAAPPVAAPAPAPAGGK